MLTFARKSSHSIRTGKAGRCDGSAHVFCGGQPERTAVYRCCILISRLSEPSELRILTSVLRMSQSAFSFGNRVDAVTSH